MFPGDEDDEDGGEGSTRRHAARPTWQFAAPAGAVSVPRPPTPPAQKPPSAPSRNQNYDGGAGGAGGQMRQRRDVAVVEEDFPDDGEEDENHVRRTDFTKAYRIFRIGCGVFLVLALVAAVFTLSAVWISTSARSEPSRMATATGRSVAAPAVVSHSEDGLITAATFDAALIAGGTDEYMAAYLQLDDEPAAAAAAAAHMICVNRATHQDVYAVPASNGFGAADSQCRFASFETRFDGARPGMMGIYLKTTKGCATGTATTTCTLVIHR